MAKAYEPPTTRRTRSQSAEPRQGVVGGAHANPNPASEPPSSALFKRPSKGKAASKDLPTVAETDFHGADSDRRSAQDSDADVNHDLNHIRDEDSDSELLRADQLHDGSLRSSPRRASGVSVLSGTTVKTSFSQEEIEQLDPDFMVDVLPDLLAATDRLAQVLLPSGRRTEPEIWKEIKRVGSKQNKLYKNRLATLAIHRPSFGTRQYIRPDIVLRALLGVDSLDDVPSAPWRPDDILCKVNLVQMLHNVLILCDPSDWTMAATDALLALDAAFPKTIAGGEFSFDALELWLDLASQIAVRELEARIEADPHFSPQEVISDIFIDENGRFKHAEAFGFDNIAEKDTDRAAKMLDDLILVLERPFQGTDRSVAAATAELKTQFRWELFKDHVMTYFSSRVAELSERIRVAGGPLQIVSHLQKEVEDRIEAKRIEEIKQMRAGPRKSWNSLSLKQVRELEKGLPAPVAPMAASVQAPTAETTEPVRVSPSPAPLETGENVVTRDFADQPEVRHYLDQVDHTTLNPVDSSTRSDYRALQKMRMDHAKGAGNAKARLTDPQPGAVRISNNMLEEEHDSVPPATSSAPLKRSRAQMEDDRGEDFNPTQDEGFESDTRDHSDALERRRTVSFHEQAHHRDSRINATAGPSRAPNSGLNATAGPSRTPHFALSPGNDGPSPAKRPRQNPGSSMPPPLSEPQLQDGALPTTDWYRRTKVTAKFNRIQSTQARQPQQRSSWTDEEESALIELITDQVEDDQPISWTGLKTIDNERAETGDGRLTYRSSEDMRFKARNMKMTMLMANRGLPRNWDKVVLPGNLIEKLHSRGIEYDQAPIRARPGSNLPSQSSGTGTPAGRSTQGRSASNTSRVQYDDAGLS